jgi:hypothetical protein
LLAMDSKDQNNEVGTPNLAELFITLTQIQEANTDAKDEPTPQCSQPTCAHTFEHTITSAVFVPDSHNALISAYKSLYLFDTVNNKILKTLELKQPIAKLIPSRNGSLCAALLIPDKNKNPEIRFINCSRNSLEMNNKINPIAYVRTNDYEIAQEAAFSADGCWLAAIETNSCVSIHNLKMNKAFKKIRKDAKFPIFSVDCSQDMLAIHANLETSLYSISSDLNECQPLRTIDHQALVPGIEYVSPQGAWLVEDMIFVRIGNMVGIYNTKKELLQTFTVEPTSCIYPCPNNKHSFIELKLTKKAFRIHNLRKAATPITTDSNICKTTEKILFDKSSEEQITLCAQNKTLVTRNRNAQPVAIAQPSTSLPEAIFKNDAELVKTLIKNMAPKPNTDSKEFAKAFKQAAFQGFTEVIQAILTTIPLHEQAKILEAKNKLLLTYGLARRNDTYTYIQQREIRAMIDHELIKSLVEQQMERVEQMLAAINADGQTAYDIAKAGEQIRSNGPRLVIANNTNLKKAITHSTSELLDPENSSLRKALIEESINEILFAKPKGTGE